MCGLFGYLNTGTKKFNVEALVRGLSIAAQDRGHHATGIAFNEIDGIIIQKAAKTASEFAYCVHDNTTAVMGHTRHTTQGSEKRNQNNHPFSGNAFGNAFALAHNGILDNDIELRKSEKLPKTEIETDTYVAVQLLEKYGLSHAGLKKMAELVSGMFTFTILTDGNTLHVVRNDAPFYLVRLTKSGLLVYGSTQAIVEAGLKAAGLLNNKREEIPVKEGTILSITAYGTMEQSTFEPNYTYWESARAKYVAKTNYKSRTKSAHQWFDDLEEELLSYGFFEEEINLLTGNYSPEYLMEAISNRTIDGLLYEVLREEYRYMRRELRDYERQYGKDLIGI